MLTRLKNSLVFRLERVMMRGAGARFGVIVLAVVVVAVLAGLLARLLAPDFGSVADAVWWAFLRLTDSGYLGDDTGLAKASISTVTTLFGYVLFTGALVAILVQWLSDTVDRLGLGLTPVALKAHVVLLGWTSRTPAILQEIMVSQGRVERFLRRRGVRRLRVVLLIERVDAELVQELRQQIGAHWSPGQIILRSGSPLSLDDLERVDFAHASAIVIPAADTSLTSVLDADTRAVKTLMTMASVLDQGRPEERPLVVVELQDIRHRSTLLGLYGGPMEVIAGDELISRLMVQNVRHPGLSQVYDELLSDASGSQVYVRDEPSLTGVSVQQLVSAFPRGVLLGVVRPTGEDFEALLNPPGELRLAAGDRIAVLASSYADAAPLETLSRPAQLNERPAPRPGPARQRRILLLGWNHRVPALLRELAGCTTEIFEVDIVSQVSAAKREKRVAVETLPEDRLKVRQVELDYAVPAYLERIDPAGYDNLVLLASERLKPGAESDARTILGYLLLRELMAGAERAPPILVEITDPDNVALFDKRPGEIIVTPVIVSHIMARVTLRRELRAVFDELFSSGGCEIFFRRAADYGLTSGEHSFAELQRTVDARGEIAIGIKRAGAEREPGGGVRLNLARDALLSIQENDELIVLASLES